MRRVVLTLVVAMALGAAVPALGQAPAVQELVAAYLTAPPADFNCIAAPALKARLDAGEKIFLLDVREPSEYANGHIAGAVNVPIRTLVANLDKLPPRDASIVTYCGVGTRGAYATMALSLLGYTNVKNLGLGLNGWTAQGFPTVR
ncbi:MAG: rhodanese-like domain-containing protein [Armatimonadota bacterium]|nr:rhodanese-like domain-containing protein [Armatimonadota bacterium]MDR7426626.1 rhodanese-like domain-containing protein [Armatimonadota bacterium]MDR7464056.1 rhodanese-like domain-containing protein [Armatimonadota bacterium]MDR7468646.1 rhodanese-like domain-containing protein [Armatimonadota bacterium]MDR7473769.1 rhodanese-like domain-containing protein [Armatimonadota bacterium]